MELSTLNSLLIIYLLALLNNEKVKRPQISKLKTTTLDKELKEAERELRKITRNKKLTVSAILVLANKKLKQEQKLTLKYILKDVRKYERQIKTIIRIPNTQLREQKILKMTNKLKNLNSLGKIPVKTNKGIYYWDSQKYYERASRNMRYQAFRDSSYEAGQQAGIDVYKVLHTVKENPRPLCEPYENKLISWDKDSGSYRGEYIYNIADTSYGEPAGLFGINCRHVALPYLLGETNTYDDVDLDVFM